MNNSALDEHIKKQFGNYKPDVPPHIWENIAAEKDRKKPAGFWWGFLNKNGLLLLLGILLLGTGTILYRNFYTPSQIKDSASTNDVTKSNDKKTNTVLNEKDITNSPESQDIVSTENQKYSQNKELSATENNPGISANNTVVGSNATVTTSIQNKNNKMYSSSSVAENDAKTAGTNFNRSKRSKGKAKLTYKNAAATTDEVEEVLENSNTVAAEIEHNDNLLLNRFLLNVDLLHAENNLVASVKKPARPYININVPCPESEKNAAGNKRYFEIYAGPDYAFRSITDTGNSTYLQKRKESSHFSSAFSVGLRYTKVFNNGMSFRTGINYSQINEKFKFAEGNIIQVVYIVNSNGDTTGSFTSSGTRYKTTYNKYKTIDVPLLIGYELGNGRLHANFNAGAMVNVYSWQKGDVLDTSYKPVSITTGKTSSPYQFKTNVGIGFLASVSVYYKLTNRLHLLAEPYFRYNFSPASKADLTIKQKYNTAGIRLGIRLDF